MPQTPRRSLYDAPQSAGEVVNFLPRHLLLNAFGVSLRRLRRLKSNVPFPKQFSGSAPASYNGVVAVDARTDATLSVKRSQLLMSSMITRLPARS